MTDDRTPEPYVLPDGEFLTSATEADRLGWPWRWINDRRWRTDGRACFDTGHQGLVVVKRPEVMATIDLEHLKVLEAAASGNWQGPNTRRVEALDAAIQAIDQARP